ncbi:MAG: hypothetical protein JO114_14295 [Planctomycetaceae bacterium]|nr:hypothetical protein [Planctomycetaceae bacterium]
MPIGEPVPVPASLPRALKPTRSGPVRAAATPRPTARATPAARPGPLHPTRQATAARASPSACGGSWARPDF